jgi:DNA-binding transcriptional MerR regulator
MDNAEQQHSLSELCILADIPVRTFRYYVQTGLVDRPVGGTKGAKYGVKHLEQLLLIKKWTASGVSLERVKELLKGDEAPVPARARKVGAIEVCSHLLVADGLEVVLEPQRAGLSPEQVRKFAKGVLALYESITSEPGTPPAGTP